jgi:signal transduction histidine kinase
MIRRLLLGLFLACWSLAAAAQAALELRADGPGEIDLAPHAMLHADAAASPDPQALFARGAPDFHPATAAAMTPGYSASAFWLRVVVHNADAAPQGSVLVLEPARMESVALFWRRAGSGDWQHARAGTDQPYGAREFPLRESAFAIRLAPGETRELLLRVASRGAVALRPSLWKPAALLADRIRANRIESLLLSLPLMLIVMGTGLFLALLRPVYGVLAAYLLVGVLWDAAMHGTAFEFLWPDATDWAQRSLGILGGVATLLQALAVQQALDVRRRQPRLYRVQLAIFAASVAACLWCLWGDYRAATQAAGACNTALIALTLLITARAVRAGAPLARACLLVVICQQLGVVPSLLSLWGLVADSRLIEEAPVLGCTVGAAAMLAALLWQMRGERLRRTQQLEATVRERTAALVDATALARAGDEAKGRLLGYIGHDLRAPLASMLLLTRQLGQDREFETTRRAIESGTLMLLETIDELQRFAHRPDADAAPEILAAPLYLHGLLVDVAEQAQAMARSNGNRLALQRRPGLPAVIELDAKHLRQVLFNLLSNAAKFTRGGEIVLEAGVAEGRLLLDVRDTGKGIVAEDLPLVFEPFVRAAGTGRLPGLGLGLSIAREAVRAMGGDITVWSRPGTGSRFSVELPLRFAEEEQVQWPSPDADEDARDLGAGWHALVLDACPTARDALAERLALAGFDAILQAATLDEAREQLQAPRPRALPWLLVLEPLGLPAGAEDRLREWASGHAAVLRCSACPAEPGDLAKPAPHADWWSALRRGVASQGPDPLGKPGPASPGSSHPGDVDHFPRW